ncbi:alpha-amylase [Bacillus sp. FJAT-42376]|uniref:alpha-amylase n=1 Tax=Bacillus sp. FJAT-42376 TaxID=2014076 RepID=UPI000F4ED13C|nr:alpha-amylase [Bacillus sp. FJAT-42376]AZB41019.1 alpha-amylase [Bacillus sp. FJAT-42376]
MPQNHTMMQFFEWHLKADGEHWKNLKEMAPKLKELCIDSVWIPPVTKGQSAEDTGYGVYDLYDLGEFDQKGTVRTKYGTKDELLAAIDACHNHDIQVYADIVMNHKAAADETETFQVVEVDPENRENVISEPFDIEGWTKFTFPGRKDKYSSFKWNFGHFNGTDYDAKTGKSGIFRILGKNKDWNENVDDEFGNYDYLMFANIDYDHPDVQQEMIDWGKWLADTTNCDGFRLDAIKHINHEFIKNFAKEAASHRENFYMVGEFWNSELKACQEFLDQIDYQMDLFDVSLHYKLHEASIAKRDFDLSTIFDDTLVQSHPMNAVTFVDNHDSQPNEALESWVGDWFKQSAYALILLRKDGYPCVFYGDYFGIGGDEPVDGKGMAIDPLLRARCSKAYGEQDDYFDHPNTIGWVRRGVDEMERSGCAVVISNGDEGEKRMFVGEHRAGEVWSDLTGTREDTIEIEEDGFAVFPVNGESVSVWALADEDES